MPTYGGYTKEDLAKAAGSAASSSDYSAEYDSARSAWKSGADGYQKGSDAYDAGRAVYDATTPDEEYGGNWSGNVLSDPDLAGLKQAIDDSIAAGDATRAKREANARKVVGSYMSLITAVAIATGGTVGAAVAVVWLAYEAWVYVGSLFAKKLAGNDQSDKDAATAAVTALWAKWRMAPPVFASDVSSARGYANAVNAITSQLDDSDHSMPWREEWVKVVDNAIKKIGEKQSRLLTDAALAGWIPTSPEKFAIPPLYSGMTSMTNGVKWGERYVSGRSKDGGDNYSTAMSFEAMKKNTDPQCAGIGMMVASYTNKQWEPLIEKAVAANTFYMKGYGAYYPAQILRLRDVFRATLKEAGIVPSRGLKIMPLQLLPRGESSTGGGAVAAAGAGVAAGLLFGGPIGIAVGLGAFLLFGSDKSK